jgi:hypothetical protein
VCCDAEQSTVQGQLAAAAYLASSQGKMLPGISVTQLTQHLNMHMKVRAAFLRAAAAPAA